ncbi:MAG: 3-dehydroquinate synthase [Propionicimonas sp.]|uniref:3-dehydroquinate synthase n=1 Tax=Propionicimonas sp. TaxID=1955623 RepID=UPI002B21354C|nr:3-dehydroquinate synthase [Propionicimonas sp.]MEA4943117.1 3-dehydroquinate synthase [Propionicimonas sp.]
MNSWEPIDVFTAQPYQVLISPGVSSLLPQFLDGVDRVAVIHACGLEPQVASLVADLGQQVLSIPVPQAELAKTPAVLQQCWELLAEAGFTRSDAIVGFGGGATTDLAGFVAATWLRGVRYIAMPTTVLAMVDAAVGGKTGINLSAGKNLVGAFYEPFTVLGDLDFLQTLPPEELNSGFAEVLKCGFIADPLILDSFEEDPADALQPSERQARLIRRAVAVKASVVSADLREQTSSESNVGREALNYGHTLGHAIERREHFGWRHGYAVSVGMVYAAELSHRLGMIDAELVERHRDVLAEAGLPVSYQDGAWPDLRQAISLDKKARGHTVRFVVLESLGSPYVVAGPDEQVMEETYRCVAREQFGSV